MQIEFNLRRLHHGEEILELAGHPESELDMLFSSSVGNMSVSKCDFARLFYGNLKPDIKLSKTV